MSEDRHSGHYDDAAVAAGGPDAVEHAPQASGAGLDAEAAGKKDGPGRGRVVGARMVRARKVTLACVFAAVIVSLAFDSGLGTPSSFGVGQFFLLCPMGGLEAMVASKSFLPVSAISMGVVLLMALVFGRAWCAWGCPAPAIRRFFKRDPKPRPRPEADEAWDRCGAWSLAGALRHLARDTRTWSLVVVLVAVAVAGLPLFCLVCPIGLTFGTVGSLWHLIVDKQMTLSVLVFPAALVVELVACRTWCVNLCPVAGLLGIVGQFAHRFRPQVNGETCLRRAHGVPCDVCRAACPDAIDLHAQDTALQLGACSRCGECAKQCPTASIDFKP